MALRKNTTGNYNTGIGVNALLANTTGYSNIALGYAAGSVPVTGITNIHIGNPGLAGDTRFIRIGSQGSQLKTFIAGISSAMVTGAAVVVNNDGQLGVVSSSRRYKEDIQPMGNLSAALMALQPVTFRYKDADDAGQKPIQYGLIAEDVAKVLPELVVLNADGQPETVAYHVLPSLLLNEYQKQNAKLAEQSTQLDQQNELLVQVTANAKRDHAELAQVRESLAQRDQELAAIRTEMLALRQVTQQLMAAIPSASAVELAAK